jgi:hypothetical protein
LTDRTPSTAKARTTFFTGISTGRGVRKQTGIEDAIFGSKTPKEKVHYFLFFLLPKKNMTVE